MSDRPGDRPGDRPVVQVRDDHEHRRFVVEQDGEIAELTYREHRDRLVLVHTGVPEALEGRGIAGELVRAAVAKARVEDRTVWPWCSYARSWLEDHADVAATVTVDWSARPD